MVFRNLLVPLLAPSLALTFSLPFRRQDVGIYTTFLIDDSCDKAVVQKAHDDAVKMSGAALDIEHDELSTLLKYTMNWNGAATIDYFGSPQENNAYREHILRTVLLSGSAYRGWGWSDYWNDRYVTVTCNDPANDCGPSSPAYTSNDETRKYPLINYCPTFFQNLTSHDDAWKKIQNGPADLKQNIRNLRSQATTALHELLHVNSHWSSNVCAGGCVDTYQYVNNGQERVPTYKAGRTKLLARRNVQAASMTNDNYAYWVMSRWMEKQTKIYPKYPLAWDPSKSRKDNEDREAKEPGVPDSSAFDIEDSGSGGDNTNVKDDLITADKYPEWYKPILDAMGSDTVSGEINQPTDTAPVPKDAPTDSIECETTDGSPLYFDCVHAFTFNDFRDQPAHKGKRDGNHWEAYVQTCAINVRYQSDWTDDCKASIGDILDHASSIFRKCTNNHLAPSGGRCGGHVPITIENCPGDVQIIHTPIEEGPESGTPGQGTPPSSAPVTADTESVSVMPTVATMASMSEPSATPSETPA